MLIEIATPTLIAEATRLHGEVTFLSATSVFGIVEGTVIQQSYEPLQVGKTGWVFGSILSQGTVFIEGRVEGDITSETKIKLGETAMVTGTLRAPAIQVLPGAVWNGECIMKANAKAAGQKQKRAA